MKLSKLPKVLPGIHEPVPESLSGLEIAGVAHDSRRIKPGWVFVAIKGHQRDGADFAADAVARGAIAVVAERPLRLPQGTLQYMVPDARRALASLANVFHGRPSRRLQIIGVTGTNGKTTTTHMVRSIIEAGGQRCGLIGTIRYETGSRILPASVTTPESVDVQEFLAEMRANGLRYAVMEVSSHALCMNRVDFVQFAAGVFTNLTEEHMDYHGNRTAYVEAKQRLFRKLGPANHAVINRDDPAGEQMARATCARVHWYGMKGSPEMSAAVTREHLDGIDMTLRLEKNEMSLCLPMLGRHNVFNALAAAGAAHALGFDPDAIRAGLEGMPPVPGRLERVPCEKPCRVLVDFAHTDHALDTVLRSLRRVAENRILVVFGAGGDRDRAKRPRMGRVVEQRADLAWITSDNPRSEDPSEIINEIVAGVRHRSRMRIQPDRRQAIAEAVREAQANDIILIAGKGHERTQRFRDTVIPFDDRDAVSEAVNPAAHAAIGA